MSSNTPDDDDDAVPAAQLRDALALRDAPPALLRAAMGLWPTHGIGPGAALRRIVAALSFDSAAMRGGALATRSASASARHLLFSAGGHDIDLRVVARDEGFDLSGQVLGPEDTGALTVARADDPDGPVTRTALDRLGEFAVQGLAAGRYELAFALGDALIVLPPLDLGPPPP